MNYSDECTPHFGYATKERFADIQLLRYRLNGFEQLSLLQKQYIYYLSKATLYGRDITFDQFGKYNLRIRKMLEAVYTDLTVDHDTDDFRALEIYLKRIWFSNGIYHHYGSEKFQPGFTADYLRDVLQLLKPKAIIPLHTENPEAFAQLFKDEWQVIVLNDGDSFQPYRSKYFENLRCFTPNN